MAQPAGKRRLRTLLGTYPHTASLKNRALTSDRIELDFTEFTPVWDGFDSMVRHHAFDVSEMAAVTYLAAMAHDKPMVLLPAAMFGRFQHPFAIYNADRGPMGPRDLEGKRVGVRAITTTTGAWLRGILANDYGVDLDSIHWVTFEEAHVAECEDHSTRAPQGKTIVQMLLDGELDAVLGERSTDPRIRCLFGDADAEAVRWHRLRSVVPINHLVVVSRELVETEPETVREVYRLLREGKTTAGVPIANPDPIPFGIEKNRPALQLLADYAFQLGLVPRRYSVDEMFAPVRHLIS